MACLIGGSFKIVPKTAAQSPVVGKCLIIKYQVLRRSLFDGLQDKTVGAVDRGNNLYRPLLKPDCRDRTVSDADAATKTDIFIYHSFPPACLLPFSDGFSSSILIASTGHTLAHFPRPMQVSILTEGI